MHKSPLASAAPVSGFTGERRLHAVGGGFISRARNTITPSHHILYYSEAAPSISLARDEGGGCTRRAAVVVYS